MFLVTNDNEIYKILSNVYIIYFVDDLINLLFYLPCHHNILMTLGNITY